MVVTTSQAWRRSTIALLVAIILAVPMAPADGANPPCCPIGDPSIGTTTLHRIFVVQGDDPDTLEPEPEGRVFVTHRSFWSIPWNNSEVYTYVPPDATEVAVDQVEEVGQDGIERFIPGAFSASANPGNAPTTGRVEEGNFTGFYSWSFPDGKDRVLERSLEWDDPAEWKDFDTGLTASEDWDTSGGTLILLPGVENSTYVSKTTVVGFDLVSLVLTCEGGSVDGLSFQVSGDNGTTWSDTSVGTATELPGPGNLFKWRVTFDRREYDGSEAVLDRVVFGLVYTPEFNDIWLETRYVLTMSSGALRFNISLPFDADCTGFILRANTDVDMELLVEGTEMESLEDAENPGRTVHRSVSEEYSTLILLTVGVDDPGDLPRESPGAGVLVLPAIAASAIALWHVRVRGGHVDRRPEELRRSQGD